MSFSRTLRNVPPFFWAACSFSLLIVVGALIYSDTRTTPELAPRALERTDTSTVAASIPDHVPDILLEGEPSPDLAAVSFAIEAQRETNLIDWSQVITEGHYKGWTLRDAMADFDRKAAEWKEVGEPRLRALIKQVEEETKDIDEYLARAREENDLGNDELTSTLVRLFEEGYTEEEAAKHPTVLRLINEKFGLTDY